MVTDIPIVKLLVLVGVRSIMEGAGRKLKMGRQSLPAQTKYLKVVNVQWVSRVMEETVVKTLMNAKRNFTVSARVAAARIHGEAMSAAVVMTICYT